MSDEPERPDPVALKEMKYRLAQEAKERRRRRRDDDDDDGGALVPARPKPPGPRPLVGAVCSPDGV